MNELVIIFFILEAIELIWQKGDTLYKYLNSLYYVYKKNLILFFCLHPSFYFTLFCIITLRIDSTMLYFLALFKATDILFKISLLNKLDKNLPLHSYKGILAQDKPLPFIIKTIPLVLYTVLFYFSLPQNF